MSIRTSKVCRPSLSNSGPALPPSPCPRPSSLELTHMLLPCRILLGPTRTRPTPPLTPTSRLAGNGSRRRWHALSGSTRMAA
eukprot:779803-Rhodomonas_salina.1